MKKSLAILALLFGFCVPTAFADDDLQMPSDVEGVEAAFGDSSVTLTWEMATDNVGVTGYKVYYGLDSVAEDGGSYTFSALEVGDVLTYTLEDLENDVTYYFALTALDAAGNESEYYSLEVSATPEGEGEDEDAPYIVGALALTDMVVEVIFSEEVIIPVDGASVFEILNLETDEALEVLDAYASEEDSSTVLVTTGTQEEGVSYMITAGTGVSDEAGNHIVSGTSDTAVFDGGVEAVVAEEEEEEEHDSADEEEADEASPEIDEVESTSVTEIVVTFNEAVVLPEEDVFEVTLSEDGSVLEVLSVTQDEDDLAVVTLETAEQSPGESYILTATGVTDEAGNELTNTFDRTASFEAVTLDIADLIPPEDVTNFLASLVDDVATSVELNWTASLDSAGDLDDQVLYQKEGEADYDDGTSLGASAASYEVDGLTEGMTYTFKLTTKDESGNESVGVISTITLPETGAGLGAVLLATVLGTHVLNRRRKN